MWGPKAKPADDPAQKQRSLRACITTRFLVALLLGRAGQWKLVHLDEFSEVILIRNQIKEVEDGLAGNGEAQEKFKELVRRDFSIVDVSGTRAAELYNQWSHDCQILGNLPNSEWFLGQFFWELDIASRLFLAKARLAKAQVLMTDDLTIGKVARLVHLIA